MTDRTLATYAVLKAVLEDRRVRDPDFDYLDLYVPFAVDCLEWLSGDLVSGPELQQALAERFDLRIPGHVITTLLKRLQRRRYVALDHQVYRKKRNRLRQSRLPAQMEEAQRQHAELVDHLRRFSRERFLLDWDYQQAQLALEQFLLDRQADVLNAMALDCAFIPPDGGGTEPRYVVGCLVQLLLAEGGTALGFLETAVLGSMLTDALFFPEAASGASAFRDTTVVFDTTFLLFALGHAGAEFQGPCSELLTMLRGVGADMVCFRHTADEMIGVLDGCARGLRHDRRLSKIEPSFLDFFIRTGRTELDVALAVQQLGPSINVLGITIVDPPAYSEHDHVIDESSLAEALQARLHYKRDRTRERDVESVSAIMRMRRGHVSQSVEDCRAVFVTENVALVSSVAQHFRREEGIWGIPPCLTSEALTSLIWLKQPSQAPSLPRKWLAAASYAAVNPSQRLWDRYCSELQKALDSNSIGDEQYYLMRTSSAAPAILMEVTRGTDAALTQATLPELQSALEKRIQEEAVKRERAEAGRLRRALDTASQMVKELEQQEESRIQHIKCRARRITKACLLSAKCAFFFCDVLVIIITWVWGSDRIPVLWRYVVTGVGILAALVSSVATHFSRGASARLSAFQESVATRLEDYLLRQAGHHVKGRQP